MFLNIYPNNNDYLSSLKSTVLDSKKDHDVRTRAQEYS